jgi:hypothetical protein
MKSASVTTSYYVTRWKVFLAAVGLASFSVIDVLSYIVWPTPLVTTNPWMYREPANTMVFLAILLFCAALAFCGLYWTSTPRPMLELSPSRLVYRRFPLPIRVIHWDDVEGISAVASKRNLNPSMSIVVLILGFMLKPHSDSTRNDNPVSIEINLKNISAAAIDVVNAMRAYHEIQFRDATKKA